VAGLLMMVLIVCVPFEKCCHFGGGNINGHLHGVHV